MMKPVAPRRRGHLVAAANRRGDHVPGMLHFGGPERMSRFEMGVRLARVLGVVDPRIVASSRMAVATSEDRPRDVALDSSKLRAWLPEITIGSFEERVPAHAGVSRSMSGVWRGGPRAQRRRS